MLSTSCAAQVSVAARMALWGYTKGTYIHGLPRYRPQLACCFNSFGTSCSSLPSGCINHKRCTLASDWSCRLPPTVVRMIGILPSPSMYSPPECASKGAQSGKGAQIGKLLFGLAPNRSWLFAGSALTESCDKDVKLHCNEQRHRLGVYSVGYVGKCLAGHLAAGKSLSSPQCRSLVLAAAPAVRASRVTSILSADVHTLHCLQEGKMAQPFRP